MADESNDIVLNCLSINLPKSLAASAELNHHADEQARNGKVLTLDSSLGRIFATTNPRAKPRAALRIRGDLDPWAAPTFTDADMATAAVKIQGVNAFVCSLYLDINFDICLLYTSPSPRD